MGTTLTREALLDKGKPRYETVEVDGVGTVGIRSVSELRRSQREYAVVGISRDPGDDAEARIRTYAIIDQIMADESTPMFTDADTEMIFGLDSALTRQLYEAIKVFNKEEPAKKNGSVTNDSSDS